MMRKQLFFTLLLFPLSFLSRGQCNPPAQPGSIIGFDPVCPGSTQTYAIMPVTGATDYTWILPNGWTGTSTSTSIAVTVGNNSGTLSVVANNNCGSSTPQTYQAVTIVPPIMASGATTFCDGGNVALSTPTGNGYIYQWYESGAALTGQTNPTYTATTPGNYSVRVITNSCNSISDVVAVIVNALPDVLAEATGPVCAGGQLYLIGNSTTAGATFSWTGPNNFPNTQVPTINNIQMSDAGIYTLTVTSNNCTATDTAMAVVLNAAPATPSPISGPAGICIGGINTYSVINDLTASQYNWTLPTGWPGSNSSNSITTTANTTGLATILVTAQNSCGTSAVAMLSISVSQITAPTIVQTGSLLSTTLPYTTYQWYNGTTAIAGATNATYAMQQASSYYVVVSDANGCTAQSLPVTLGVNNIAEAGSIAMYPNPNNGSFTIDGTFQSKDGKVIVVISDIAGRIVHQEQLAVSGSTLKATVSIGNYVPPGVYILKLSSDSRNLSAPFVKR